MVYSVVFINPEGRLQIAVSDYTQLKAICFNKNDFGFQNRIGSHICYLGNVGKILFLLPVHYNSVLVNTMKISRF